MPRTVSFRKKLSLLLGGVVLALLLTEGALRLLQISYPLPYTTDEHCASRLEPGFRGLWTKEGFARIEINSAGFRDREHSKTKPPGRLRIAVLGDSYVEALQVPLEETFCSVLESELSDCPALGQRKIEVLNFGASGHSTAQQLLILRNYVWDYDPDIVLLAFFPGNDICNNSIELEPYRVRPFFTLEDDQLVQDDSFRQHPDFIKAKSSLVKFKVWMINRSRILQLINEIKNRKPATRVSNDATEAAEAGIDDLAFVEPRDESAKRAWNVTERLISQIHADVQQRGKEFRLVIVTTGLQVHPQAAQTQAYAKRLGVPNLLYCDRRLQALADERGFPVIHLAEPLSHYAQQNGVYLHGFSNTKLGEGHWNVEGHRLVGQLISEAICADRNE